MNEEQKKEAKQRIFDAALSLFAQKGYAAVGCREIAERAGVNISMICYYFGKKVDILKAIIDECYDKYYHALENIGNETTPLQESIRLMIRNLVEFFRTNTEVAMVAFNTLPIDIPEAIDHKVKWESRKCKQTERFFIQLGLDTNNQIQMSVFRGILTTIILSHFQSRYVWENIKQAPDQSEDTLKCIKQNPAPEYNDAFYEQYSEMLTNLYLHGLSSITDKNIKKEIS